MAINGPIGWATYLLEMLEQTTGNNTITNGTQAIINNGTQIICSAGNVLCEWTGGQYNLPQALCEAVATCQEYIPLDKQYSAPLALGIVTIGGCLYMYQNYGANDALSLIKKILKKEFGDKYLQIFNIFEKAIKVAIDKLIEDFQKKYAETAKNMSDNQKNEQKKAFSKQVLDSLLDNLSQNLKGNKDEILAHVKALNPEVGQTAGKTDAVSQAELPGQQKSMLAPISREKAEKRANKFVLENFIGITQGMKKKNKVAH